MKYIIFLKLITNIIVHMLNKYVKLSYSLKIRIKLVPIYCEIVCKKRFIENIVKLGKNKIICIFTININKN